MIKEAIATLVSGRSLTMEEAAQVMEEIMRAKLRRPNSVPLSPRSGSKGKRWMKSSA